MFCEKCGNELGKDDDFCSKCGTAKTTKNEKTTKTKNVEKIKNVEEVEEVKNNNEDTYYYPRQPQYIIYSEPNPGNGVSTAGMVLGIISAFIMTLELIGFYILNSNYEATISTKGEAYLATLAMEALPLLLMIIGFALSIAGMVKKVNGKNITGLILTIPTIVEGIFVMLIFLGMVE